MSQRTERSAALADLRQGEGGVLEHIELDAADARRVMELGFIPGRWVEAARSAPGGDPRVYRVDGSEVALRRETAARLKIRRGEPDRDDA